MQIRHLSVNNFRSFVSSGQLECGPINVFIGRNNSGKSTLLKAIHSIQDSSDIRVEDIRVKAPHADIYLDLADGTNTSGWGNPGKIHRIISRDDQQTHLQVTDVSGVKRLLAPARALAPNNEIVPFLAKRKVNGFAEDTRLQYANDVASGFTYLSAKLAKFATLSNPVAAQYHRHCNDILGFVLLAAPSVNGQLPGVFVDAHTQLTALQLGEGVAHVAAFIADIVSSTNKIFLIEELENDLHPAALKGLLALIHEYSDRNQFFISTHSQIVLKGLGASSNTQIFEITAQQTFPLISCATEIASNVSERMRLLKELGYEVSDFEFADGWLIFEESSAEFFIRSYLIPFFTPKLRSFRTVSASGADNLSYSFEALRQLVLYAHLEHNYQSSTWVRADGDSKGQNAVAKLAVKFPSWPADRFGTFSQSNFEFYYPAEFLDAVHETLALPNGETKREMKKQLLISVRDWLDQDPVRAKDALQASAADVIAFLEQVERVFSRT